MNMQFVIMQLFNGLILGSIYVILSLGLTIIFGMLGIINFAHGAFYMFGAFVAYTIIAYLIPNFWVALIVGPDRHGALRRAPGRPLSSDASTICLPFI